jgi:DUF4097 and DUF4098 domain-containing protein YvlB
MNRKLKMITLILWIIIVITLLFILIYNISSRNNIGFNLTLNNKAFNNMTVQKEESMSLDGCANIKIDFSSEEIKLTTIDDDDLKIIQESSKQLNDDEKFIMTKSGDTITVQRSDTGINSGIHFFQFQNRGVQRIQVLVPKKYTKALNITSSSGDINITSPLSLSNINCNASSGEITCSDNIQIEDNALFKSTSGDIELKGVSAKESSFEASSGEITCSDNIQIEDKALFQSTSGDIKLKGVSATESSFKASSGKISLDGTITSEKSEIKTSSGDVGINELNSDYDIGTSSGQIRINSLLLGSGNIESSSGDINIAYKDIRDYSNLKSSSGEVHANVDKGISFEFEGKCTSGEIDSNFDLSYKNKKGNEANGEVGEGPYKKININTTSGDIKVRH